MSTCEYGVVQGLLIGIVKAYRYFLSPWLGNACRFEPTCSAYTLQALSLHGAAQGSYLGLKRLARCHPWCNGGIDEVPPCKTRLFTHQANQAETPAPTSPTSFKVLQ